MNPATKLCLLLAMPVLVSCGDDASTEPDVSAACIEAGEVTLTTQAEVDAAAGLCEVASLNIHDADGGTADPIESLAPLSRLRVVLDGLRVGSTSSLTSLAGLAALESAGTIEIAGNAALETAVLTDMATRSISITSNPALTSISMSMSADGDTAFVDVRDNEAVTTIQVEAAGVAEGGLSFVSLPALSSLTVTGFDRVSTLWIGPSPELSVLSMGGVVVTGWLDIHDTALSTISGIAVTDSMPNKFIVRLNQELASIDAFSNLESVGAEFWIFGNPSLCVPAWAEDVEGGSTVRNIANNRTGC